MQQLQLAINAHINYDLPEVMARAIREKRPPLKGDYQQVNMVFEHIAKTIFSRFCLNADVSKKDALKMNRWLKLYVYYGQYCRKRVKKLAVRMATGNVAAHRLKNRRANRLSNSLLQANYPLNRLLKIVSYYEATTTEGFINDLFIQQP